MKMSPNKIIKLFIENENSALAPRLRNDSLDDNAAFLKWQNVVESTIKEIRNAYHGKIIPEVISLFGNSYLHDSKIHTVSVTKNNVNIAFLAAENFKEIKIYAKFTNADIIYYNPNKETHIMDTRIFLDSNEKCITIWLGRTGMAIIKFNSAEMRYAFKRKNISLDEMSKFESYGCFLII